MTDTFRALCAELTYCWSRTTNPDDFAENAAPIIGRMRAALAQLEKECDHPITPSPELIIKAADDAGLCFPTCWGLVDAEEDAADDAAFAATSPEAAEIVAKHEQLKRDRLQQLRNFWNTAASYGAGQEPEWPTVMEIIKLADEIEAKGLGQVDLVRRALARWGRPKPPSLKEQALELARPAGTEGAYVTFGPEELALIRRALEALPND